MYKLISCSTDRSFKGSLVVDDDEESWGVVLLEANSAHIGVCNGVSFDLADDGGVVFSLPFVEVLESDFDAIIAFKTEVDDLFRL